jgi:signal transduction histidine kinase
MRTDLRTDALLQLNQACHSLLSGSLGALTELQVEDLQSIERAVSKLTSLIEGEPIDWTDYTEVAHALRGPLNTTLGFSRLMLKGTEGPINEAQREALETTHTMSRRLLALFNLLLDGLQLMDNDISVTIEPVRVNGILQELITLGRTLAVNRGAYGQERRQAPQAGIGGAAGSPGQAHGQR